ncbi:oxidoreductase FAD-binding domain-containing protein [Colletotrichum costaricense]|uniref:Oxidoreductase FAD-binding domain-containing protein n=1 Tax=Colletotrichum costaricense TaxID=1209916 RepID=A0AAI9YS24_9PEZI|nr:oxidoreductase FAD-binding domain-containing protein [Colletotrichum costaricense]KAK1520423.1 oxidoreductase FAD-binding domain-containing protein [Colletotrichum costaricense]
MNHTLLLTTLLSSQLLTSSNLFFHSQLQDTNGIMPGRTIPFHQGELALHEQLKIPRHRANPTAAGLPPSYGNRIAAAPLLALGTLDAERRPWTTLWGGEAGNVARPIAEDVLGLRSVVDIGDDPVFKALWGAEGEVDGDQQQQHLQEVIQPGRGPDGGKLVSGLAIDLTTRDRVKFGGRMVAGAVTVPSVGIAVAEERSSSSSSEVQIAVHVEESLGNCPKYLNKKDVIPRASLVKGRVERELPLSEEAVEVVRGADMLFLTSGHEEGGDDGGSGSSMDTNHRGGSRGFVRVARNDEGGVEIVYPEFSGNRLYQTLGNLKLNPLVGIAIPDFETSDVLYVSITQFLPSLTWNLEDYEANTWRWAKLTGSASILVGQDAAAYLPRTKLAVKITVSAAVFVQSGLPFSGTSLEPSPYNPPVRPLFSEQQHVLGSSTESTRTAALLRREIITPTIARFVFGLEPAAQWEAGQYVTFDFAEELDVGWSHMRDDEPQSLNDDYVRTFTVSSPPGDKGGKEFEITARKNGPVTNMLWRWNLRVPLEVPVLGFGGEEAFRMGRGKGEKGVGGGDDVEEVFVAAGVGITPLIAQAGGVLEAGVRMKVLWTVKGEDVELVRDVVGRIPGLAGVLRVFVTGEIGEAEEAMMREFEGFGAVVERRRIRASDVKDGGIKRRYFLCTGPEMLKVLNGWLEGENVAFEDFAF